MKQLSREQSAEAIKQLFKTAKRIKHTDLAPGNLLIFRYDAKYKDFVYDRRPMILILRVGKRHTLGLNFHWIPFRMRIWLIKYIIKLNKDRIRKGEDIEFSYQKVKPLLKKMNYAPCIRLYINRRMSKKGIMLPPSRLIEAAQLKMEMFTGISEEELWQKIKTIKQIRV